jgi:hypothetical protein
MRKILDALPAPGKVPKVTGAPVSAGFNPSQGPQSYPFNTRIEMRSGLYLRLPRVQGANTFAAFEDAAAGGVVDIAKAQAAIASLKAGYLLGLLKLGVITAAMPWERAWGLVFGPTEASKLRTAQVEAYKQVGKFIEAWSTTLYEYAKAGRGGAGQAYTWEEWGRFGNDQADQVAAIVGAAWNIGAFKNLINFLKDVPNPLKPDAWPTWAKVLVGLAAAGAGLYAVNTITQAKRTFLPSGGQ